MLTISPEAFSVFQSQAEKQFAAKLGSVLRDAVPSLASEPEPVFSAQVRLIIEQARGFGLQSEQAIGAYAVTAGLLGVDFPDCLRGAHEILVSYESEGQRANLLENFTLALFEALEA